MKIGLGTARARRPRERGAFRSIVEHRNLIGLSAGRLSVVGVLAVLTGLGQAALLLLVVRLATALTANTDLVSASIGPIGGIDLSTGDLTLIAFLLLLGLFVAELASSWAQASLGARAQRSTQKRMLANYSAATFDTQTLLPRGETTAVVFGHSGQAAGLVSTLGNGLGAVVNFVSLVVAALVLSPVAGLIVVCGLVVMLLALRPLNRWSRRLSKRRADEQRRSGAISAERFELTREIKAFGTDQQADAPIRAKIDTLTQLSERLGIVSRMTSASYRIGAYTLILGMMALIDAADAQSLTSLTGALLILLRSLSYGQSSQRLYLQLIQGLPVVEQLAAEDQRLVAGAECTGGAAPSSGIGNVALRHVSFAYRAGEPVLHDVSLEIHKGDFVAVVGASGAGKSTLMHLLLRLRSPSSGDILVDGFPISEIDLAWWRSRVAYVPQEPKLQAGSVTDTIRFNRPGISDADVRHAARQAHISDEIESWPDTYESEVGQLGDEVSGGQRQRIALARALAGRPDLLLLDEPTSALDPTSEKLISATLEELRGVMTVVVIAHRFHTVQRANRVVLLEDGRVVPHETDDLTTLGHFMGQSEVVDTAT